MIGQFHYKNIPSAAHVALDKARRGLRVSCIIPTLNEENNISGLLAEIRTGCMERAALIDEIIVIDSSSVDDTRKKALAGGAQVFAIDEIPGAPRVPGGKGSALWKSLWVSRGDIVICLDADITNFQPHFITGLLSPLLSDASLYFVKAFYQRPLQLEGKVFGSYGGRVTEILVRPFLNAFFPEMARFYQPLSGEYAFRRSAMESISFCSGYGVEIHCLFEFLRLYGLKGIAQVDIGTRLHRNRPTSELGKMAFAILQVLLKNASDRKVLSLLKELRTTMDIPSKDGWDSCEVSETFLPSFNDYRRNPKILAKELS
jgi:glucosyl-3-phosphoglycerate synthase